MNQKRIASIGKQALIWFAIIVAGLAGWVFKDYLDVSLGTWLLFIGMAIYMQFAMSKLTERIGLEQLPTFDAILANNSAEPIVPKHEASEGIPAKGWGVSKNVHLFYGHFSKFADVLNDWLKDTPWRLQEEAETDVGTIDDDGPVYGRRYRIFHGPRIAGRVSLSDGLDYSEGNPSTHAYVELHDARSYHAESIMEFLEGLASHVASGSKSLSGKIIRDCIVFST